MEHQGIPHYVNDPVINAATAPELKLVRPKVNYWKTLGRVGTFLVAVAVLSTVCSAILECVSLKKFCFAFSAEAVLKTFPWMLFIAFLFCSRFVLIWFVMLYQQYAKSETRLRCCFVPSCSEYAILALKKYGTIIGGSKTLGRLIRCHPPGGEDYP
jgi:putative membrane protein insertion efficiency factor